MPGDSDYECFAEEERRQMHNGRARVSTRPAGKAVKTQEECGDTI